MLYLYGGFKSIKLYLICFFVSNCNVPTNFSLLQKPKNNHLSVLMESSTQKKSCLNGSEHRIPYLSHPSDQDKLIFKANFHILKLVVF